ncbi:radical SAM protein [Candidatus Marinamargulisbacteria bacterium SCGC AAA071-K20]|nr:radical SAM protein [Candidatus Marinamargulisbacteria bacterium SCGC AAA071-K20]
MKTKDEIKCLNSIKSPSFTKTLKDHNNFPLRSRKVEIFQMNVGNLCNMTCSHCHVEAGPDKTDNMTRETFETCLELLKVSDVETVDLTGGAPEMNPNLLWFIPEVSKLNKRVIVRSNLTILLVPKYSLYLDLFSENNVEVVASLPCYLEDNTDLQRGKNVFKKSIEALQELNKRGYAKKGSLKTLNLVHNPVGTHLPPKQQKLETDYKAILKTQYNVEFNSLFCITNMPIKRYLDYLIQENKMDKYMSTLVSNFNPSAVENVMCRNTISIGYDGALYDCDFNQMLELPLEKSCPQHVNDFSFEQLDSREIILQNHCYGCTAGAGSSCQGEIN